MRAILTIAAYLAVVLILGVIMAAFAPLDPADRARTHDDD